ncbi:hypothetical protein K0M31_012127 [Melipona bicolor]|uniref:Uncharacterized protein n=1 Tax=Melipona bicolor TaxID=60889 RepID=A0AA40GB44_9HYME|nr:hypothetical protein K0M31_012127 [Melipona bicolor]
MIGSRGVVATWPAAVATCAWNKKSRRARSRKKQKQTSEWMEPEAEGGLSDGLERAGNAGCKFKTWCSAAKRGNSEPETQHPVVRAASQEILRSRSHASEGSSPWSNAGSQQQKKNTTKEKGARGRAGDVPLKDTIYCNTELRDKNAQTGGQGGRM